MYILFKNNRPAGNKKYATYNEARQAARKLIRKHSFLWQLYDIGVNSNPTSLKAYGYEIRKAN
jgi:hypothetical protein